MEENNLEFIPWVSAGGFVFGDVIDNYQDKIADWEFVPKNNFGTEYYRRPDDNCLIGVENNKIRSIFCYDNLTYQNTNLIGLTIDEFKQITNANYIEEPTIEDFEEDGYPQTVYEFDDIGAQVWEKKGRIVTIIVAGKDSYSEEPYD